MDDIKVEKETTIKEESPQVDYEALINEKLSNYVNVSDVDKLVNESILKNMQGTVKEPEPKDEGLEEVWVID